MPLCRSCGTPIFFLSPKPTAREPHPKALPIDVNPDQAGNVAIVEFPSPNSVYPPHRDFKGDRMKFLSRLYGEALKSFLRLGGVVYRVHFDSCPARVGRQR